MPRPSVEHRLPKGLSQVSLARVNARLSELGSDASAAEIAESLGMSRVSARRYLEHLVATGAAAVSPRYGSAGRPEHRYRTSYPVPRER